MREDGERGQQLAEALRRVISTLATASTIARPMAHSQLLALIVKTAGRVIRARAGSVLLLDPETGELVFEASATEDIDQLRRVRIPFGQGIAGLVALTGQPMAVADAQTDPRHAAEAAKQTGLLPNSLLCVPLIYEGDVIGVLELLDKESGQGFDALDMEALGLFAQQAAIAIEQSRIQADLGLFMRRLLNTGSPSDADVAVEVAEFVQTDPSHRRSLELGVLVRQIAEQGEDEARACKAILTGFAEYLRTRPGVGGGSPLAGDT